ncbi:MAG: efflux RND transporter periplasmic adaptor subunit [Planctomycetes bacterium]|nr:efflux RND transporter periplasmic adaptor subunit [Planctomycetota bacterium]
MIRTRLKVWACGLALGLAVGGAVTAQTAQKVVVTSPRTTDVVITQQDSCQIRSRRHIEIRAMSTGYLEAITVREGQGVKQGEALFRVIPQLYKAKLDTAMAEVQLAKIEFDNTKKLFDNKVVSVNEVRLSEAKLAVAQAKARLAETELGFTTVKAPFDGLLGRLETQEGSLISEKDALTTLSDNSVMWVYFHVPEVRYLEYKARQGPSNDPSRLELVDSRIELVLADGSTFKHAASNVVTVENSFNNGTGNISFRVDFPNHDRLLRQGQTGIVQIRRTVKNALIVPQRATIEILDRRYVYVVDKDDVARQREIVVQHEVDDTFVIKKGLDANDRIVLDGLQRVRDGEKVESEFRKPEDAIGTPKTGREK